MDGAGVIRQRCRGAGAVAPCWPAGGARGAGGVRVGPVHLVDTDLGLVDRGEEVEQPTVACLDRLGSPGGLPVKRLFLVGAIGRARAVPAETAARVGRVEGEDR